MEEQSMTTSAGSHYEATSGFPHMVMLMGFTSTGHLNTVKTLKQLGAVGTPEGVAAARRQCTITSSCASLCSSQCRR